MSIADQLNSMMESTGGNGGMPIPGITIAKVTNVTDDDKFNRVKCLPLGQGNEKEETDWCYVMSPMGGKDRGTFFFPQVDDLVVLAYLENDRQRPLVLGAIWNTETTPPYPIEDGKVENYSIRTPTKIELLFHDEADKQTASLTMPSKAYLKMDDEKKSITISDDGGKNSIIMNLEKGEMTLTAEKKLTLKSDQASIVLESSGKITIDGAQDVVVKSGANLKLQGTPKIEAKATNVEVTADAKMNLKANAQMAIEGAQTQVKASATLDLNASAMATLKGGMVKIN